MRDIYREVTDTIAAQIAAGASGADLVMPWHAAKGGMPVNATSGHEYRGVNVLNLWAMGTIHGFASSQWATYKQWQAAGAQVRKGAKGAVVVYYSTFTRADAETGEDRAIPFLRHSHVFNADQVEGWTKAPVVVRPALAQRLDAAEAFAAATGATIEHGGARAFYAPSRDLIQMPDRDTFRDTPTSSATEGYYSTLFHELAHWTGHDSRLARTKGKRYGDAAYAFEELIAELGAAFTCARLGITNAPRLDHAQYIASWLQGIKDDPRALFRAASDAAKAADWLAGKTGEAAEINGIQEAA
jgi:antirestriction protein ArdC